MAHLNLVEDVDAIKNRIIVRGANTGVDGAQIMDTFQTSHPVLPAGVYQEDTFSSFLIEYVNASQAGAASATEIAKRILKVRSRLPIVVRHRTKADPRLAVGATVAILDTGIGYTTAKNFFIYALETSLDCVTGAFDQQHTLDGGTGNSGYTTIPPPDASFSWRLVAETLAGDAVVEVFLDGSGSTSLSGGEIVSWDWSTSTTTYSASPNSATGVKATLLFLASAATADITLTVTDTTSKTGSITQTIDLTGADTMPPIQRVLSVAFGAAWYATPDGGATWNIETTSGDAIAVGTIGAGADDRAAGTAGTYGILATRGSGGAAGLRGSLDLLATSSTNFVSATGALTSNIWVNEANPARVWFAIGTAVYRSTDGGVTKTAMHAAPATVNWIMEDPSVDNSVFIACGADFLNATDPTVGWAVLYPGPIGATARQFVRSRDGQVTWICYTGAPSGEALQRVENGAAADIAVTDIRTLTLDNAASALLATLWAVTADNPAQIWSFDGLTGLSATQATPTLPAGATAQHMLSDPDVDLLYIADFDSVAVGTGAVRKFLADQLYLYKAGATGQQAHMLGFGARATAPAEVLRMTIAVDPGGVWHYRDGFWTFRPLPVSGTVRGVAIVADPFNPSRWLAAFNNNSSTCYNSGGKIVGDGWAYSPIWETEDAGVTWTEVILNTPGGWVDGSYVRGLSFNDQNGNSWAIAAGSGGGYYTAVFFGASAVVSSVLENTTGSALVVTSGAEGEWILEVTNSASTDGLRYVDAAGAFHTPAGSPPANLSNESADRMPGTSRMAFTVTNDIFSTTDYRAAQPTALITGVGAEAVTVGHAALYYSDSGDVFRVVDPTGAATTTQLLFGNAKSNPRVDRQTRMFMGVAVGGSVLIDDGTTARTIPAPDDEGRLSSASTGTPAAFEIMVRG
jgi:hypothetical protein